MELVRDDEELDELQFVLNGVPRHRYIRFEGFDQYDEESFRRRYRLKKDTALFVLHLIGEQIEHPYDHNNSVSPINQLLVFLRLVATGSHLMLVGDYAGMHESTVCRINKRVAEALAALRPRFVKPSTTPQEISATQLGFYTIARMPRVTGVIDCTHIRIKCPGGDDPEIFRNRKGFHSINTQIVADSNLKITDIVARWPGSSHDSTIFNNSRIKQEFEENHFPNSILLGDSGYFRRAYLLTPILHPNNRAEERYNESLTRTRQVIERVNGIFKKRFPILAYGSRLKLENTLTVIVACAVLHNLCIEQGDIEPPDPEDVELFQRIMLEDEVPNIPVIDEDIPGVLQGTQVRQQLVNYFATLDDE